LEKKIISANELASYVVCPEAWRLKSSSKQFQPKTTPNQTAAKERKDWIEKQGTLAEFKLYTKVAYVLLVMLVILVFLLELNK
jgi:hypothetical protein